MLKHGILEEFTRFFGHMWWSIVLLECNVRYAVLTKYIDEGKQMVAQHANIHIGIDSALYEDDRTELVAGKASPYHLRLLSTTTFGHDVLYGVFFSLGLASKNS